MRTETSGIVLNQAEGVWFEPVIRGFVLARITVVEIVDGVVTVELEAGGVSQMRRYLRGGDVLNVIQGNRGENE